MRSRSLVFGLTTAGAVGLGSCASTELPLPPRPDTPLAFPKRGVEVAAPALSTVPAAIAPSPVAPPTLPPEVPAASPSLAEEPPAEPEHCASVPPLLPNGAAPPAPPHEPLGEDVSVPG